jgi:hypothetical protein
MARIPAILKSLATAYRRDQKSLESVVGNNFFLVTALLLQKAGIFIYLLIGFVLLFPLSTDPLRKIPVSRLALWPLSRRDHWILRAVSPWVNPISWVVAGLAVWAARGHVTFGLWALVAGLFAGAFILSDLPRAPGRAIWLRVPNFPGAWNQLVRKNLREILSTLDFYCAVLLCLSAIAFRFAGIPLPAEGLVAITVLSILALSSYAQCLFGLDGEGGLKRYRLLPLRGWQILAAKDAAFLLIAVLLSLPMAPLAGIAAALIALALGHSPSVTQPREQIRWRFSTGVNLGFGLLQAAAMAMAASATYYTSPLVALACVPAWAGSLWYYGREWEFASREAW